MGFVTSMLSTYSDSNIHAISDSSSDSNANIDHNQ